MVLASYNVMLDMIGFIDFPPPASVWNLSRAYMANLLPWKEA
jgi:hypothetical protein